MTIVPRAIFSLKDQDRRLQKYTMFPSVEGDEGRSEPDESTTPSNPIMTDMRNGSDIKFKAEPAYIYFYKIGFGKNGDLKIEHFIYYEETDGKPENRNRIKHTEVVSKIEGFLSDSRKLPPQDNDIGRNFRHGGKHWNRLSYVAFMIDHPKWSFCDGRGTNPLPAVFAHNGSRGPNHCFFDGAVEPIDNNGDQRNLFYCVNHARDKNGKRIFFDEGAERSEYFKFDLWTKFDFGAGFDDVILIFDPGGDNQGPPVPPYAND